MGTPSTLTRTKRPLHRPSATAHKTLDMPPVAMYPLLRALVPWMNIIIRLLPPRVTHILLHLDILKDKVAVTPMRLQHIPKIRPPLVRVGRPADTLLVPSPPIRTLLREYHHHLPPITSTYLLLAIKTHTLLLAVTMGTQLVDHLVCFTYFLHHIRLFYLILFLDHTATSHNQQPSSYSQYNNYGSQPQPQAAHYPEPSFNPDIYNSTGILNTSPSPPMPAASVPNPYTSSTPNPYTSYNAQSPPTQQYTSSQRQYTLGGDGYGANAVPPLPAENNSSYFPYPGSGPSSSSYVAPANTNTGHGVPSQVNAANDSQPPDSSSFPPDEAPPDYDAGTSGVAGHWGKH